MTQQQHLNHCKGFTLVELMMGLVVAAVLLTVGIPSFTNFVLNQRVKTTAFELVANLNYARSEAIKQNRQAVLQAQDVDGVPGYALSVNGDTLRTFTLPGNVDITAGADTITFNPDGRSTAAVTFVICDQDGSSAVMRRTVRLDISGRPNLTRGETCDA